MSSDHERLTILEMEYRIVAARLDVIDNQLGRMNQKLDSIDKRTEGTERAVRALLRHFNIDDEQS